MSTRVGAGALLGFWLLVLGATAAAQPQAELPLRAFDESGSQVELPLTNETLRVTIDQQHASTVLRHLYHNQSGRRLEGQFVFRAGQGTAIDGFAYWNGEQKIVGEIFETEVAREVYDSTVSRRKDPGLLEKLGEGSFSFKVFPIEPDEHKRIELKLDQWLPRQAGVVEYRLPVARDDSQVRIDITDDRPIRNVSSPSHQLELTQVSDGRVQVDVKGARGTRRELILRYEPAQPPWTPAVHLHRDAGHDAYLVLNLAAPPQDGRPGIDKDVTLVIDHSGSMNGEPLAHARAAAADVVRRLDPTDRLNVLVFDDAVDALFAKPKPATVENRAAAIKFIEGTSEGGGTDLALALRRALGAQHDDQAPKSLLFLTDGQSDPQDALDVARADKRDVRVFTIGIGAGVDRPLLARLAAEKRGRFTFIESVGAISQRIASLYSHIAQPALIGLSIEVEGAQLRRLYPPSLPDLFANDELRLVGRLSGSGEARITLRGTGKGGPREITTTVQLPQQIRRPWVGKLWGLARVDHLLEEIALNGETAELRSETLELALAYNIVTPYTSFLAIPESELSSESARALAAAKARKQALLAQNADAQALQSGGAAAPGPQVAYASPPSPGGPPPERAYAAEAADMEVHGGGCASCSSGSPWPDPVDASVWALLLSALLGLRARASRRSGKVGSSGPCG